MLANIHRDRAAHPEPYHANDFIRWRDVGQAGDAEPVLLDDAVAQGNLMRAAIFGRAPKPK